MHRPTSRDLEGRPIINRAPNTMADRHPRSRNVMAPAALPPGMETMSEWTPFGLFAPRPYFGGHDGLGGRLMHVPQADMYDASPNPWPNNAQWDRPGGMFVGLLRLKPDTSAHRGAQMHMSAPGPTMLFHTPPLFGLQTTPIPAVGA